VLVVVLLGTMSAGCGDDGQDELVIYSGRTRNLIHPLLEQFSEETGIDIAVRYDDSAALALLLAEEGNRSEADVFISQSPGAVGFLSEAAMLGALPEEATSLVPEGDAASDGTWVGLSGRVRTLVYNTDLVDPADLPDSVMDLTDPEFAGQVGVAPTNGSFQDFVTVMRTEVGEEETEAWLSDMADAEQPDYSDNTSIVEAVGRGEVPMGLVNHYYAFKARDEDPDLPVENHYFGGGDYGSTLLVTAASVVEGSDRSDEARQLVEFLLGPEAQAYFSDETFEFPLASGAEPNEALPSFDEIDATRVDLSDLGGELEATSEMINQSGLDR
jgi:iron(III) transport system substrate-binding protein